MEETIKSLVDKHPGLAERIAKPPPSYDLEPMKTLLRQVGDQLLRLPGVNSVGVSVKDNKPCINVTASLINEELKNSIHTILGPSVPVNFSTIKEIIA